MAQKRGRDLFILKKFRRKVFWFVLLVFVLVGVVIGSGRPYFLFRNLFDHSAIFINPSFLKDQLYNYYGYLFRESHPQIDFDDRWMKRNRFIAHGMGAVDGISLTNSAEAFHESYQKGFRVFEVDFLFSLDGHLIARHDRKFINLEDFLKHSVERKYTPLDLVAVRQLMTEYKDVYLVTDFKQNFGASIRQMVAAFDKQDTTLIDRVIPQIYRPFDYYVAMQLYPFRSICFTLYRSRLSEEEILQFLDESGVRCLVMRPERLKDGFLHELEKKEVSVYVHTINDKRGVDALFERGVWGVYTDTLFPELKHTKHQ